MSATISTSATAKYPPVPEDQYQAVLAEVVDYGVIQERFDDRPQHKVQLVFQIDALRDDGKRHELRSWKERASMHEKANLRAKFLEKMLGKQAVEEILKQETFDLETLVGTNCMIDVVHDASGQYANIGAILRYRGNEPMAVSDDYVSITTRKGFEWPPQADEQAAPATKAKAKAEPLAEEPLADTAPQDNAKPTAPSRPPVSLLIEIAKQAELTWGRLYDDALDALCKKTVKVGTNDLDAEQAHQVLDALRNLKPAPPPIKAQEAAEDGGGQDPFADEGEEGYTEAPAAPALAAAPKTRQRNTAHV